MKKIQYYCYRFIRFWVWLFYPKIRVVGSENLPEEPCIAVSNHCQMNGPIATELYFPGEKYIWCAGEMMVLKKVPDYAYGDFWSQKPRAVRWFYRLLSYIIAPVSVCVFNNAHTIAVHRDQKILSTFRDTLSKLKSGANVIIFPEQDQPYDHILCQFQEGFVDIARTYYKQTGKAICFVPMYLAPELHTMYLGQPVQFCPEAPIRQERQRICSYLMEQISLTARNLPRHRIVPYKNIPRKDYPCNVTDPSTLLSTK